jgi:hypothetical protein
MGGDGESGESSDDLAAEIVASEGAATEPGGSKPGRGQEQNQGDSNATIGNVASLIAAGAALLGLIVGAVVTWGVTEMQIEAAEDSAAREIEAAEDMALRERRQDLYDSLIVSVETLVYEIERQEHAAGPPTPADSQQLQSAWLEFRQDLSQVALSGGEDAKLRAFQVRDHVTNLIRAVGVHDVTGTEAARSAFTLAWFALLDSCSACMAER